MKIEGLCSGFWFRWVLGLVVLLMFYRLLGEVMLKVWFYWMKCCSGLCSLFVFGLVEVVCVLVLSRMVLMMVLRLLCMLVLLLV